MPRKKKYVFTKKRKQALKKARRTWKGMSHKSRKKAMPNPSYKRRRRRRR